VLFAVVHRDGQADETGKIIERDQVLIGFVLLATAFMLVLATKTMVDKGTFF
jgi:hypothetical protein